MATTPNNLPADRDLRRLLEQAQKDYQENLNNLTDAATDEIETAINRGDIDVKELVNEYARDASQLANDYYDQLRGLWAGQSAEPMPEFLHDKLVDPTRVLWQVEHGFSNTDFNGLTYQQVMAGQSRAGMTIDDLWPPLDNVDDAQQFIADMIATSGRLTMQRNIAIDPTKPKWARVCGSATPCAFCVMLASRGFAYNSQETADFGPGFHDGHCHCSIVPSWGKDETILAKQRQWKDMYDTAEQAARHAREKATPENICAWLRYNFPGLLKDGVVFDPDMRIPKDSRFAKQLGGLHTLRMNQLLRQAAKNGNENAVRLWAKYAGQYEIINTSYEGTAEFDPESGGIRVNLNKIGLDSSINRAYETMFHESSHMLDWILGGGTQYGSFAYHKAEFPMLLQNDAVTLHNAARRDLIKERPERLADVTEYEAYLKKNSRLKRDQLQRLRDEGIIKGDYMRFYGSGHTSTLRAALSNWRTSIENGPTDQQVLLRMGDKVHAGMEKTDGALDDMIFAQYNAYRGLTWHPPRDPQKPVETKYFKDGESKAAEAWAEMMAAQIANPHAWTHIQKWFPQSSKLIKKMTQEALNG